jgi:hypothetical protein
MLGFVLLVFGLALAILTCLEIGWRIRRRNLASEDANSEAGLNGLSAAVYGLMGLLIAFTFSGAAQRFEARRALILKETNDIGTAYLRIDMLPADVQPKMRQDFRDYLDARLAFYAQLPHGLKGAMAVYQQGTNIQNRIWSEAVAATARQSSAAVTSLVLGALNSMIDDTTSRLVALETHPPVEIYFALGILVLASSVLAGYAMAKSGHRNRTHWLIYAGALAFAIYLILDMDYPRLGLVRINTADHFMVDLRNTMK